MVIASLPAQFAFVVGGLLPCYFEDTLLLSSVPVGLLTIISRGWMLVVSSEVQLDLQRRAAVSAKDWLV